MLRRFTAAATASAVAAPAAQSRGWHYKPRTREYNFLYNEVFDSYNTHYKELGVSDTVNSEFVDTLTEECSKLCVNTLFPCYMSSDQEGCTLHKDGKVTTPKGYKEAWRAIVDGGWQGVNGPEQYGGQGLPSSIGMISKEMMATANWPLLMYPGLSSGAATTLQTHGTEQMKNLYLRKILEGTWSGTMCLTEPHCGTDLAQVKTKAIPSEDGKSYKITGTKIFISAGEHDLTENIVHICLARLPDAPAGTKGISLFLIPKYLPKNEDGTELDTKRNVTCIAIEKKMGIHGNSTCQLAFEDSVGFLIGGPHEGMKQMFTFMNTARIGTAVQGIAHAELAFQNALAYARERTSMRSLSGTKNKDKVADLIIHHPNVRHNILFAKAVSEGGRALVTDLGRLTDKYEAEKDPKKKKQIDEELGLLTPIAKGCLTELGLEAAILGQQCFGGHGFIQGNGMELIVRDARISTLYEGTTGVQALDFIGRKVLLAKNNEVSKLSAKIAALAKANVLKPGVIGSSARTLWMTQKGWRINTMRLMAGAARDKDFVGSASVDFLHYSGYVVLGYYWLRMAVAAQKQIDAGKDVDGYYKAKVDTCRFYFDRMMPRALAHSEIMLAASDSVMGPKEEALDL